MPNWCENTLTVEGPEELLEKFFKAAEKEEQVLCFQNLHPMPEELEGTSSPGEMPNWYDWRVANWGTKWNTGKSVERVENSFSFDTAWSPPESLFDKVAADYPELTFRLEYAEPGMNFAGFAEWAKGERIESEHGALEDYEWGKRHIWECCEKCEEDYQPHEGEHKCEEVRDGS